MHEKHIINSVGQLHRAHPELSPDVLFSIFQICREMVWLVNHFAFEATTRKHVYSVMIDSILRIHGTDIHSAWKKAAKEPALHIEKLLDVEHGTITLDGVDYEFKLGEDE